MMKKIIYIYSLIAGILLFTSCENEKFIDNLYVEPQAAFSIPDKDVFEVFESVYFSNKGEGQNFVVWPGDSSHVYGKSGNNGYACNADGGFSYAYQEPGEYTAVWVASSIKANGNVVFSIDSIKINVQDMDGGLTLFNITRMARLSDFGSTFYYDSYGEFIEDNRIICPMPYQIWPSYIRRTLGVKFTLESDFAKLYWASPSGDVELESESTKVFRFDSNNKLEPQTIKVRMSSGTENKYEVAALVIPEFTTFRINGVDAIVTRDLSAFNKFNITLTLTSGTDLTALVPDFIIMNNDSNLLDSERIASVTVNGVEQTSGTTAVDFTNPVEYVITYSVPGSNDYTYTYKTYYQINITTL